MSKYFPHVFQAAEDNDEKAIREFVEHSNFSVNTINQFDHTIAHVAARKGNLNILKYVLEKDASILSSKVCRGEEVLHLALKYGHLHVVKYLVEIMNQDIEKRFSNRFYGNTAIHFAVEYEYMHLLKYLLEERNGDVNVLNDVMQTPVFLAIENRFHPITKYLLEERGADIKQIDYMNDTILDKAANADDFVMMRYLINDRKMKVKKKWRNDLVLRAASFNRLGLLKFLVGELKAKVNFGDPWGNTPLHVAAHENYYEVCKYLIESGANIDLEDIDGITPVQETKDERIIALMTNRTRRSVAQDSPIMSGEKSFPLWDVADGALQRLDHPQRETINSYQFYQNFLSLASIIFKNPVSSRNLQVEQSSFASFVDDAVTHFDNGVEHSY